VQRNLDGTFEKENSDGNGRGETENGANPRLQTVAGKFDGAKNQREFNSFAEHHEKYEKENAPAGRSPDAFRIRVNFLLNIFAKMSRNAIHPDDHRNNEDGGNQQEQSFEAVFADAPVFERNRDGQAERGGQAGAKPDESCEMGPRGPGEIDKNDADDEGGLDAFTKSDQKSREQGGSS
jgi:hypothetical protein